MRVALTTLGCKVNQYETQRIARSFAEEGFEVVPFDQEADWYVVNSCSVTDDADGKSRYVVRRARRDHPGARVLVTGCSAQAALNRDETFPGADLLVPNPEKLESVQRVLGVMADQRPRRLRLNPGPGPRARATLKVQDGCDVRCSYCSIPSTRPVLASRPLDELLDEARALARLGHQEVVLTGVSIGAYDGGLPALVTTLARESGVPRFRPSSVELHDVSDELLGLVAEGDLAPHLHVPLQSGDDDVLAAMGRRYRRDDYLMFVERLRRIAPQATLTTDIMVGFPNETDERFMNTLSLVREAGFLQAHVFRFSPRQGTLAAELGDPVPPEAKRERAANVSAEAAATGRRVVASRLGTELTVVFEASEGRAGALTGISEDGISIQVQAGPEHLRQMRRVIATEQVGIGLVGRLVQV